MNRWRWWLGIAVSAIVVGALMWVGASRNSVRDDIIALRKDGILTSYDEVEAQKPKPEDNGGPFYQLAINGLAKPPYDKAFNVLEGADSRGLPENSAKVRKAIADLQPMIDLCRRGASKPRCYFPLQKAYTGARTTSIAYAQMSTVCDLLLETAHVKSSNGDTEGALRDLASMTNMLRQMAEAPDLGALQDVDYDYVYELDTLALCMNQHSHDRKFLNGAKALLDNGPPNLSARKIVSGSLPGYFEDYTIEAAHPELYSDPVRRRRSRPSTLATTKWALQKALAQRVHFWRVGIESIPDDPNDWAKAKPILNKLMKEKLPWPASELESTNSFMFYTDKPDIVGTRIAMERVAKQSVAILLCRLDHGSLPDSLPLSGSLAIDPYSGKPLVYRKVRKSFMVYSLGTNGNDDGGNPNDHGVSGKHLSPASLDLVAKFD